jgi:hypothetical protein
VQVDVVLGEDRGFWNAVETFISTTKRPIVLTATDERFVSLFNANFETLKLRVPQTVSGIICIHHHHHHHHHHRFTSAVMLCPHLLRIRRLLYLLIKKMNRLFL